MANPGNSGKRYRFRVIDRAIVSEHGGVTFILTCGHRIGDGSLHNACSNRWTQEAAEGEVGKRQACFRCGAERDIQVRGTPKRVHKTATQQVSKCTRGL